MMMKTRKIKLLTLMVIVVMLLTLVACGQTSDNANDSANDGTEEIEVDESNSTDENSEIDNDDEAITELTEQEKKELEEQKKKEEEEAEKQRLIDEKNAEIAERTALEEVRKIEYGEFYVPLLPLDTEKVVREIDVKALYATGYTASNAYDQENIDAYAEYIKSLETNMRDGSAVISQPSVNKWEKIIAICKATEMNSIVFDIKDDNGFVTYKSDVDIVNQANDSYKIEDLSGLIDFLHDNDIYTIARIVTFKDKNFSEKFPDHCIQKKDGGVWYDPYNNYVAWVNPYDKYVWDYDVSIAKEVSLMGFDEINFDYIRFPDNAKHYNSIVNFGDTKGMDKDEAVGAFLAYTNEELEPYNVNISCDVFGIVTRTWEDYPEDIGQTWIKMANNVDYISPMSYPSHYGPGWYGLDDPNSHPYEVMKGSMSEALEKCSAVDNSAETRPWIQGFSWAGVDYGPSMIRDQIIAAKEYGINTYFIWSASNYYNPLAYIPTNDELSRTFPVDFGDEDYAFRNPSDAIKHYLTGYYYESYSWVYLLTPIDQRPVSYDDFEQDIIDSGEKYTDFDVYEYEIDEDDENLARVTLDFVYDTGRQDEDGNVIIESGDHVVWTMIRENGIWKLKFK